MNVSLSSSAFDKAILRRLRERDLDPTISESKCMQDSNGGAAVLQKEKEEELQLLGDAG